MVCKGKLRNVDEEVNVGHMTLGSCHMILLMQLKRSQKHLHEANRDRESYYEQIKSVSVCALLLTT